MSSKDGPSTFTYDSTSQLTGANHTNGTGLPADEGYVHDLNGNRVSATAGSSSSAYATGTNNQLLSDGTYNYSYDLEGNRTGRTRISDGQFTEYRYDHLNQLVFVGTKTSASAPTYTSRVQMVYDLFGRRFQKLVDSDGDWDSQSGYVSDGMHVVVEYKGSSLLDADFVRRYLHGPAIDQVLFDEVASGVRVTLADHLNTVRDVIDLSGNLLNHVTYDSFGRRTGETNTSIEVFYGFTGRPYDEDTGLQNNLNRWYDAVAGRWISEDPIGFAGDSSHLLRYARNSPNSLIDPDGTIPLDTIWDLGNIIYDIAVGDYVSLSADAAALVVPYVPAGGTKVFKVVKKAKIDDVVRIETRATKVLKVKVEYKYLGIMETRSRHFVPKSAAGKGWIKRTRHTAAKFTPGTGDAEVRAYINKALQSAKARGLITPKQLDGFLYNLDEGKTLARRVIGASEGKCTSRIKLHVHTNGEIHAFPF